MLLEKIDAYVDRNKDLTSYTVEGRVTAKQIITTIEEFHQSISTKYLLLDFSNSHVHHLQNFEIESIANVFNKHAFIENLEKIALVFSSNVDFGIGRMFETFTEIRGVPQEIMSFHTVDEAYKWLNMDR